MSHKIYKMSFSSVYPHYVKKADRKGRTEQEVIEIIHWLTGYSEQELRDELDKETTVEDFSMKHRR